MKEEKCNYFIAQNRNH